MFDTIFRDYSLAGRANHERGEQILEVTATVPFIRHLSAPVVIVGVIVALQWDDFRFITITKFKRY